MQGIDKREGSRLTTYVQRNTAHTQTGMNVLHCPHFASSRSALASVPSRSINHTQRTTKLNRRGCFTISLPFLKGIFSIHLSLSLYASTAYQPSTPCMLCFVFPSLSISLSLFFFLVAGESLWCQLY